MPAKGSFIAAVAALAIAQAACSNGGTPPATGSTGAGGSEGKDILAELQAIPGLSVEEQKADTPGFRYFVMRFDQPADHNASGGVHFEQRLTLLYRDRSAPVVFASTGYDIDPTYQEYDEPAEMLDANEIMVEHRFFSPSRPSPADWSKLTIWQAAADHHAIIAALRPLFSNKWISTGISKGGMTSVYHRRFFPGDVDATIAYSAPESYGTSDPRYVAFLQQVGDPSCRAALLAFQNQALMRRDSMKEALEDEAEDNAYTYSLLGEDAALDYSVIELAFTFWQYFDASYCSKIPPATADDDDVWSFLDYIDSPYDWDDDNARTYEPYFFQAATQLGYPGYDATPFAGLLTVSPGSDVASTFVFPGPTKTLVFHPEAMQDVATWLSSKSANMMFVYGQNDPYSAAAFDPGKQPETYRFYAPAGNHLSMMADLTEADQATANGALESWLGIKPKAPRTPTPEERRRRVRAHLPNRDREGAGAR